MSPIISARSPGANGLWAVVQQMVTLLAAGVFSVAIARVLAVLNFFNYVTNFTAFGAAIMAGSLQTITARETANRRDRSGVVMNDFENLMNAHRIASSRRVNHG